MKYLILFFMMSLTLKGMGLETALMAYKLYGDSEDLRVEKKKPNGVPSLPFIESPNDPFKSLAITGGHLVSKKCIVDILPAVPAGHRVGVYDPNTNHLILGRYNGTEYLYDSDSHFKWEMIWDLDDVATILFQSRSALQNVPLLTNYFGSDIQVVLPYQ